MPFVSILKIPNLGFMLKSEHMTQREINPAHGFCSDEKNMKENIEVTHQ